MWSRDSNSDEETIERNITNLRTTVFGSALRQLARFTVAVGSQGFALVLIHGEMEVVMVVLLNIQSLDWAHISSFSWLAPEFSIKKGTHSFPHLSPECEQKRSMQLPMTKTRKRVIKKKS